MFFPIAALVFIFGGAVNLLLIADLPINDSRKGCFAQLLIFLFLYAIEFFGAWTFYEWCEEEDKIRDATTYMIEMPNGISCEGTYYSGKNDPIYVTCVDGRKFVVNGIEVKYRLYKGKRQ